MTEAALDLEPHLPRLHRYARSLTHDRARAEDLVQDTLVRALQKAHYFRHDTNLRGWLITIMHNEHVNAARRQIRGPAMVSDETLAMSGRDETQTALVELRELRRAVGRLPADQREALLLNWVHGYKYEEIAAMLAVPLGTIQSRISRARKSLRAIIAEPDSRLGLAHSSAPAAA